MEPNPKEIFLLTIPNMETKQYIELLNLLRPVAKKFNLIVTPLDVKPVSFTEFKDFAEKLKDSVGAMEPEEEPKEDDVKLEEVSNEVDMAIKEKALELLKSVPAQTMPGTSSNPKPSL